MPPRLDGCWACLKMLSSVLTKGVSVALKKALAAVLKLLAGQSMILGENLYFLVYLLNVNRATILVLRWKASVFGVIVARTFQYKLVIYDYLCARARSCWISMVSGRASCSATLSRHFGSLFVNWLPCAYSILAHSYWRSRGACAILGHRISSPNFSSRPPNLCFKHFLTLLVHCWLFFGYVVLFPGFFQMSQGLQPFSKPFALFISVYILQLSVLSYNFSSVSGGFRKTVRFSSGQLTRSAKKYLKHGENAIQIWARQNDAEFYMLSHDVK